MGNRHKTIKFLKKIKKTMEILLNMRYNNKVYNRRFV